MSKSRVKHVAQFVHSFKIGGAEVLAFNLAKGLSRKGFQCSLWGMAGDGGLRKQLDDGGVDTVSFDCPDGVSPAAMINIARRMISEKLDVVVTHHFRQLLHAVPGAVLTGTRLVHVEHDYHFYKDASRYLPALRLLLRFTANFVVVSNELVKDFKQGLGDDIKCTAIPNGVDTGRFKRQCEVRAAMRREYGFDDKTLVIGACSRLEPVKQIELLLAGFSDYIKRNPCARLLIVGDGSQSGALLQEVHRLDLSEKVIFAGSRGNVHEFLSMFDIFTLTSRNEGLPLAVLEAMATELPVVSTNVGSVSTVIGAETGILLQHQTPELLSNAFTALEDVTLRVRMGKTARDVVHFRHSMKSMVNAYSEVLQNVPHNPSRCFLESLRGSA